MCPLSPYSRFIIKLRTFLDRKHKDLKWTFLMVSYIDLSVLYVLFFYTFMMRFSLVFWKEQRFNFSMILSSFYFYG